jgi:hypothetical protein
VPDPQEFVALTEILPEDPGIAEMEVPIEDPLHPDGSDHV